MRNNAMFTMFAISSIVPWGLILKPMGIETQVIGLAVQLIGLGAAFFLRKHIF